MQNQVCKVVKKMLHEVMKSLRTASKQAATEGIPPTVNVYMALYRLPPPGPSLIGLNPHRGTYNMTPDPQ